ncbi:hypothetical protein APE_0843.1 [Aeropyrum pernix spindle-shaped virus 1]|uniref:Uncharacterized protein n=1 Tax=Aeropyrum pernix (strain ATCC 700893 / DSM 11879 / JCM 9820 / NBRC 100138 / K1) TaxID=272557 RepID=Q9YDS4_AERPE|nr:hypothetical protein [Aeropyrum pernix]BAA79823.2 hypothetical protein APE_0843.1 [Aeropyrum pernix spindle-shaped virus 1] [Aeropyrum pernix K1]
MRPGPVLILLLVVLSTAAPLADAGVQDWVTPGLVLDASPHLWLRMADTLVQRLYDPGLNLFRETWGTPEGRCWYWNTEQGEAAQIAVYLNDSTLLSSLLAAYKQYLIYESQSGQVYLFSRYTPCSTIRQLSLDPQNFSLGNLIVNIGGDLAGTRTDVPDYHRVVALSLDIYKDPTNIYEQDKAWPNMWYTANLKSHEVWYLAPGDTTDYKGIWDTSDGSLGTGSITSYSVRVEQATDPTTNTTYDVGVAERTMEDANLSYTQRFVLEPRKPYVKVELTVTNKSQVDTLSNVRVTLAFDNLDWWLYKYVYIPGVGLIDASTSGTQINTGEKEYHLARTWEGFWQPVTDSSGRAWWPSIIYADRPLGMNRGLLVLVDGNYGVNFWGYGNYQAPQKDLYGVPAYTDWYYRWLKYEVVVGDLPPGASKTVEILIVPMASYAPGLEDLYIEMASKLDQLEGRDFSYAVNTGTGAFKGLAMARIILAYLNQGDHQFAQRILDTVGQVMEAWGWMVSTRALSNYILSLVYLYDYTGDRTYLDRAEAAAQTLLQAQIRDPQDPRNGGFLDIVYPYGVATYLDVNAEAAHALLALWERTGDTAYREAVDYWLQNWFRREQDTGRWYYYRYKSLEDAPSEYWYKGYLDEKQPYAQGYFLQALAKLYWSDERLLVSFNRIMELLSDEYWELTWEGADETNVETQSSAAAGLREYLLALAGGAGAAVEYVRGGELASVVYEKYGSMVDPSTGLRFTLGRMVITVSKPPLALATVAVYLPSGLLLEVLVDGVPARQVQQLADLALSPESYYFDGSLVYVRLQSAGEVAIVYQWVESGESNVYSPEVSTPVVEQPPTVTPPSVGVTLPQWLEPYKGLLAVGLIVASAMLATEASAPVFALAAAGLAGVFVASGWLTIPQAVLGLAFAAAGLGLIVMRKRG